MEKGKGGDCVRGKLRGREREEIIERIKRREGEAIRLLFSLSRILFWLR